MSNIMNFIFSCCQLEERLKQSDILQKQLENELETARRNLEVREGASFFTPETFCVFSISWYDVKLFGLTKKPKQNES